MAVSVYIPTPYREATGGRSEVAAEGATVRDVLRWLVARYPEMDAKVFPGGEIPGYLSIYVNAEDIRNLQGPDTPVREGDELALIPAMAGGAGSGTRAPALDPEQLERYSRQTLLPEVGPQGQRRLLEARVAIVGVGGLGAPAAMYLAAAGVGTIGLIDGDRVEASNLHRQPIHAARDIGRPKTQSAQRFIEDLNPDVTVVRHDEVLRSGNALAILRDYDVIVNGTDNFPTRYLVNDAAHLLGKPLVDASILRFEGQATVFMPGKGCYRCLFPNPPAAGDVPNCAEGGVIGALAGQMGTLQAMETLKIVLGIGETLQGRLYVYDALTGTSRLLRWRRNPGCALCGDHPTVTRLIDYEAFCGVGLPTRGTDFAAPPSEDDVSAEEAGRVLERGEAVFVDVREAAAHARGTIPGSVSMPLEHLQEGLPGLDASRPVVFFCEIGQKSRLAAMVAKDLGLRARSIRGGLTGWRNEGLPWEERV